MKIKILLGFLFVTVFGLVVSAQSVVITKKKTVYKRPKPIMQFKKTFTINYPKVKAVTPALSKKIEMVISYEKVLDLNIKDELNDTQWLAEADYEVGYNKNGILSIALSMNGSGAYPSGTTKHVVVDLKTGSRQTATGVFTNLTGLTDIVRKSQKTEVAQAIKEIKADKSNDEPDPEDLFKETSFKAENLNEFSVSDKGVTFHYDYGFPHVIQALQPIGEFSLTWVQLKPYIKHGGLLERASR